MQNVLAIRRPFLMRLEQESRQVQLDCLPKPTFLRNPLSLSRLALILEPHTILGNSVARTLGMLTRPRPTKISVYWVLESRTVSKQGEGVDSVWTIQFGNVGFTPAPSGGPQINLSPYFGNGVEEPRRLPRHASCVTFSNPRSGPLER